MNGHQREAGTFGRRMSRLVDVLRASPKVNRLDTPSKLQAEAIAHGLLDLEVEVKRLLELIPRLESSDLTPELRDDLLWDIGESFRHILYHIRDMDLYDHLFVAIEGSDEEVS